MSRHDDETVEISQPDSFSEKFFAPPAPRFVIRTGGGTHVGKVRKNNEDNYAIVRRTRSRELLNSSIPNPPQTPLVEEGYALIVADGIGGSAFGEFASRLAVETMFELTGRATSWVMRMPRLDDQQIRERVAAYAAEIQKVFRGYAEINPCMAQMGTTWTSACVIPPDAVIVHIGDSRAFLYRDWKLEQLTRDQTLGQEMADAGMPDEEVQRYRHILINSVQGTADEISADVSRIPLQAGDRLLVCSDGLTDMVDEHTIAKVLQSEPEPQPACDRLIESALEAGGKDNVTVVLCHILAAE
ncbi:MAG: PP2C family protein-serine/threonine phosphatase [Maioricimonas sp. JB049]